MAENTRKLTRCERCLLLDKLCICSLVRPVCSRVPITLVLQWSEYWRPSNTGRLVAFTVRNCKLLLRGTPGITPNNDLGIAPTETPVLLFPGRGVEILNPAHLSRGLRLIVPDGTWREAGKIARRLQSKQMMRRVQLPDGIRSRYRLRKNPRSGGVSTLEAIAYACLILGDTEASDHLLGLFEIFVERLLSLRPPIRLVSNA